MLYRFLFPVRPEGAKTSLLLLAARVIFGVLLMSHGLQKWAGFAQMADVFPDPLGVGSRFSLMLAIFGELVCSFGFLIGFLYRLAMIPMIFTMAMAFFVIHSQDAFAVRELALVYLGVFVLMYIAVRRRSVFCGERARPLSRRTGGRRAGNGLRSLRVSRFR